MRRLPQFIDVQISGRRIHSAKAVSCGRTGTAVVELAVLLPVLVMLFLVTVDFARVYYFSLTLTNCARAGALYASDPTAAVESPFPTTESAALADATNLSPQPTISQSTGIDAAGRA